LEAPQNGDSNRPPALHLRIPHPTGEKTPAEKRRYRKKKRKEKKKKVQGGGGGKNAKKGKKLGGARAVLKKKGGGLSTGRIHHEKINFCPRKGEGRKE